MVSPHSGHSFMQYSISVRRTGARASVLSYSQSGDLLADRTTDDA
jgi:hypothetical protein